MGPSKATDAQIKAAWQTWAKNVAATAAALGISRKALYKRLRRLKLYPPREEGTMGTRTAMGNMSNEGDMLPMSPMTPVLPGVPKSEGDTYRKAPLITSFPGVSATLPQTVVEAEDKRSTLRHPPGHLQALRRARRELAAILDQDLKDEALYALFHEEEFADWVRRKKAQWTKGHEPDLPTAPPSEDPDDEGGRR